MTRRGWIAVAALIGIAACHGQLSFRDAEDGGPTVDAGLDASSETGTSQDCRSLGTCPLPSLHCEPLSGACVACLDDSHCNAPLHRCDVALHRCVGCGTRGDCAPGSICAQKVCVASCEDGGTCPGNATCHAPSQICKECQLDSDCRNADKARRCEPNTGRCLECVSDTDCAPGHPRCDVITGQCVRCLSSSDCPSAELACDPATLACVHP